MRNIAEFDGILLFESANRYYLQYDAGAHMIKIKNLEITAEEVKNILKSEDSAQAVYDIIFRYQNQGIYGEDA